MRQKRRQRFFNFFPHGGRKMERRHFGVRQFLRHAKRRHRPRRKAHAAAHTRRAGFAHHAAHRRVEQKISLFNGTSALDAKVRLRLVSADFQDPRRAQKNDLRRIDARGVGERRHCRQKQREKLPLRVLLRVEEHG